MNSGKRSGDANMGSARTPIYAALALYGFYVTLHLAVGAVATLAGWPGPIVATAASNASTGPMAIGMPHVCDCQEAGEPSNCAPDEPQCNPEEPGDVDCASVPSEPVATAGTSTPPLRIRPASSGGD